LAEQFLDRPEDPGRAASADGTLVQWKRASVAVHAILVVALMAAGAERALAEQESATQVDAPSAPVWEYDPENAQEILGTCAGCHGNNGQGGGDGTYPRLAGMRAEYIAK
jgi:cytochrome c553